MPRTDRELLAANPELLGMTDEWRAYFLQREREKDVAREQATKDRAAPGQANPKRRRR